MLFIFILLSQAHATAPPQAYFALPDSKKTNFKNISTLCLYTNGNGGEKNHTVGLCISTFGDI